MRTVKKGKMSVSRAIIIPGMMVLIALRFACHRVRGSYSSGVIVHLLDGRGALTSGTPEGSRSGLSRPILGRGVAGNDTGIPGYHRFRGTMWRSVMDPVGAQRRFRVQIPVHGRLWFGWYLVATDPGRSIRPVGLFVDLKLPNGQLYSVWTQWVTVDGEGFGPIFTKVDLSRFAGKSGTLIFWTKGASGIAVHWIDPMVYRPHPLPGPVILISIDTLRADHTSCYGYQRDTTPALRQVCHDGVLFEQAMAPTSWTLPSHVSMMSGLYPFRHGVRRENHRIPGDVRLLAERFRAAGYVTVALTGGGFLNGDYGFARGFTIYNEVAGGVHQINSSALVYQGAVTWLETFHDRPLFLFLHTYQTHDPYVVPAPRYFKDGSGMSLQATIGGYPGVYRPLRLSTRQRLIDAYDSGIAFVDEQLFGPLVRFLKQRRIYKPAMIVVTSDHGEELYDHGGWGHGHTLYQELLRVPLIIKFPWMRYRQHRVSTPVRLVDIVPTMVRQMGLGERDLRDLDGIDLTKVIRHEAVPAVWLADLASDINRSRNPERFAVGRGMMKVIENGPEVPDARRFFRYPPPRRPHYELYDLRRDPREIRNLLITAKGRGRLKQYILALKRIRRLIGQRKVKFMDIGEDLREELRSLGYIQ